MHGTYLAVLDRFEGEYAVLVVEEGGKDVDEYLVDTGEIPDEECHEDAVFEIQIEDDELVDIEYLAEETDARQKRAQNRFDRLSKRLGDDP